jgi:hypothetical protein
MIDRKGKSGTNAPPGIDIAAGHACVSANNRLAEVTSH